MCWKLSCILSRKLGDPPMHMSRGESWPTTGTSAGSQSSSLPQSVHPSGPGALLELGSPCFAPRSILPQFPIFLPVLFFSQDHKHPSISSSLWMKAIDIERGHHSECNWERLHFSSTQGKWDRWFMFLHASMWTLFSSSGTQNQCPLLCCGMVWFAAVSHCGALLYLDLRSTSLFLLNARITDVYHH